MKIIIKINDSQSIDNQQLDYIMKEEIIWEDEMEKYIDKVEVIFKVQEQLYSCS